MEHFLVIYLLVVGTFSPHAVGFSKQSEYYTFYNIDEVAIKVYQLIRERGYYKDCVDSGSYFRVYKITLSAEDISKRMFITTKYYKNIEEIPLPKIEVEGERYIYLYKK